MTLPYIHTTPPCNFRQSSFQLPLIPWGMCNRSPAGWESAGWVLPTHKTEQPQPFCATYCAEHFGIVFSMKKNLFIDAGRLLCNGRLPDFSGTMQERQSQFLFFIEFNGPTSMTSRLGVFKFGSII